jgi:hypothetical protein
MIDAARYGSPVEPNDDESEPAHNSVLIPNPRPSLGLHQRCAAILAGAVSRNLGKSVDGPIIEED